MTRSRLAHFVATTTLVLSACSGGALPESTLSATYGSVDPDEDGDPELDLGDGDEGEGGGICLLNNCESDEHCGSCADGRTTCDVDGGRCVECEDTGACAPGEVCTQWGFCVPESQECELGPDGEPLVLCATNSDCLACDPSRHVCDTTVNRCVECAPNQADACQSTERCSAGFCVDKCPASCDAAADCDACTTANGGAHACVAHHCAECDESHPCSGDEVCTQGSCVDPCGIVEEDIIGLCDVDEDCSGCPGDATSCNPTINGGHGVCGPEAAGCSDLGENVVVLPEPFDQVTNLCSKVADCAGVGVQFNVGKLLRELSGVEEIDDAFVEYPMGACADVTVDVGDESISCGVCVPCSEDSDCVPIAVDEVAEQAFGVIGKLAAALVLDLLFGDNDHEIEMYCEPVAVDYGICSPCPGLFQDCSSDGGDGGQGCGHEPCVPGTALDASCGSCEAEVCALDDYCCDVEWDQICVELAGDLCANECGEAGCGHDVCVEGETLDPGCNECSMIVCDVDPYCCAVEWDEICVSEVDALCTDEWSCGPDGCSHSACSEGAPLDPWCSGCTDYVCSVDDYCCEVEWDVLCVEIALEACDC